jgi:hypothetical protein
MSYSALVWIHSIAAYVWLLALVVSLILAIASSRRGPEALVGRATSAVAISTRIGLPAAVILLIAGFWMMGQAGLNYGSTWVSIGFATWLLAAFVGSGIQHPIARRMRHAGAGTAEAVRYARVILLVGVAQIVILVIAIWAMSAKPGA